MSLNNVDHCYIKNGQGDIIGMFDVFRLDLLKITKVFMLTISLSYLVGN